MYELMTEAFGKIQVLPAERKHLQEILDIYNDAVLKTTASYDYSRAPWNIGWPGSRIIKN